MNTEILSTLGNVQLEQLSSDMDVTALNIETGEIKSVKALKTTTQKHVSLIQITTTSYSLVMTKDHPVYVEDYGFISMQRLLSTKKFSTYEELVGKVSFLVWNEETQTTVYELLRQVELKNELVDTFSIRNLSEGNTFIANGFVTKTY